MRTTTVDKFISTRPSPRADTGAGLPLYADLTRCPDGSFLLKPRIIDSEMDTWVTAKRAAAIIGIAGRSIYRLIDAADPFLVYKRPLKGRCLISLKSIHAYIKATSDPDFWDDTLQQKSLKEAVRNKMMGMRGHA